MASTSRPSSMAQTRLRLSNSTAPRLRIVLSLLLLLACLTSTVLASTETSSSLLRHRHRIPPVDRHELHRRKESNKDEDEDDEKDEIIQSTIPSRTASGSKPTTVSIQRAAKTAASTSTPLPEAFDGNLAAELSTTSDSNCPAFLNGVLSDPSYETCYPLSMMIQTSRGFFEAQRQLLSIVRVLDATCAANVTYCTDFFETAARNLTTSENCKTEIESGNSIVKQFLYGLRSYEVMYKATCLQTPKDDMYCYANAVTNTTTAANAYFYYLPYNLTLPGSTNPSCGFCTQETMNIYHAASEDRSQPIALTYEAAARQVNTLCGPDFVNSTLPSEVASLAHAFNPSWVGLAFTLASAAFFNAVL
ncbi:hypothetical protein FLONG3_4120 [Fusarium longipes]|uniref:DUF7729 domain-containing protein n=1 Tax=Fusarium longipes TaxID=694270 RepID=A0A395SZ12_9HYPO|nr:hypothetical protein FLONG3_4120 [Fusarium longipes]